MAKESATSIKLWQKALLPFMAGILAFFALAFIGISFWGFYSFQARMDAANAKQEELLRVTAATDDSIIKDLTILDGDKQNGLAYVKWRSLVLLERETLHKRYNTTHSILLAQVLTRFFGFLTGMLLALVGAVFVLGKLQEEMSDLGGEGGGFKLSLKSASPGIILAVLGTALLITTMVVPNTVYVNDSNMYLGEKPPAAEQNGPPAGELPAENK